MFENRREKQYWFIQIDHISRKSSCTVKIIENLGTCFSSLAKYEDPL